MVSTRHHPRQFPEPTSPTPRSTRGTPSKASSSGSPRASPPTSPTSAISSGVSNALQTVTDTVSNAANSLTPAKPSSTGLTRSTGRRRKSTRSTAAGSYAHVVDPITVIWLYFALPAVIWDCGYVLLRPMTMPGGSLHLPVYKLYGLYGTVDYMYGWPAWNDGVGFTAAQGAVNVIETIMYGFYVYVLTSQGQGTGWYKFWQKEFWTQKTVVQGEGVALATVICFASAAMTLSKTVLYWLNEYFSKFENVGHNSAGRLFWLWIVPNGLWLIFPTWMLYVLGKEIVAAMHVAKTSGLEKED